MTFPLLVLSNNEHLHTIDRKGLHVRNHQIHVVIMVYTNFHDNIQCSASNADGVMCYIHCSTHYVYKGFSLQPLVGRKNVRMFHACDGRIQAIEKFRVGILMSHGTRIEPLTST